MKISRRCAVLAAAALALPAWAQDYPARTITLVVPFTAGGGVDAVARLLADKLRASLKQSVVVDNKPGASGMLGAAAVAKAQGDGYTLLLGSAGETAINPLVYKARMQYQPQKDLAPITLVARVPNVLVASTSFPAKNVAELVSYAKAHPGKVGYATSGVGNPQHLNGELLASVAGIQLNHVPYKGASNQLVDVASGVVELAFVSYAGAAPFIKGGRVKVLAVTSAKRASFAPDIPAIAETPATAAYNLENWFGLFAPAATPAAVQARLNDAVAEALKDPELIKRLREQGGEPAPMTQQQFRDFIAQETKKYAQIVESAHITAE
ncbi:MAG: tripartite tricarboxylate transporter substrate binding protein [Proteobacteria bacterium]|nr:tripartite tricarboxylate transporter substrate binding protein [Pseudomonadota bacterium]MBS0493879.1 tripartite tricarboxylate transporter substrate binding protein [Pseudomonadota bacterium]